MVEWLELKLPVRRRDLPPGNLIECWLIDLDRLELPGSDTGDQGRRQARRWRAQFLLRLILGAYLQRPGKDIKLVRGASGKPELAPDPGNGGLQFNLSHSGPWFALAVTQNVAVGVDIELQRQVRRAADLAQRYFSAPEADYLAGLEQPERSQAFFRLWTAREACIKALGTSLARSLSELALAPDSAALLSVPPSWPVAQAWSLVQPELSEPAQLCIAAPQTGMRLRMIRLDTRLG